MSLFHWLWVWPCPHDLLDLVLCHLVFLKTLVVDKESPAHLISHNKGQQGPSSDLEDHVKSDPQTSDSTHLVLSAQIVDGSATHSQSIEDETWDKVSGPLLFLL